MKFEVDARPGDNACNVHIHENDVCEVHFMPDPHAGPESLWFYFRIISCDTDRESPLQIVLENFDNILGGSWGEPSKVNIVFRNGRDDWKRSAPGRQTDSPDGRRNGVWDVEIAGGFVEVALCYPYGIIELDNFIAHSKGYWIKDVIGVSQCANQLVRLSNSCGTKTVNKKPGIYLIARQHSGETPGSWLLQGVLDYLRNNCNDELLVWCIPLANIDGVTNGDFGKDNFPYDLNRAWGIPPMRHEAIVIKNDIARWKDRCFPLLCIDAHAPCACDEEGIFGFVNLSSPEVSESALQWAAVFKDALLPEYSAERFIRMMDYKSRWETPSFGEMCAGELQIPCIAIEVPYSQIKGRILSRNDYIQAGQLLGKSIIAVVKNGTAGKTRTEM